MITDTPPEVELSRTPSWIDFILYLVVGFFGFMAASFFLGQVITENNIGTTVLIYAVNILFFTGSVFLISTISKNGLWQKIGLWPIRLPWKWIAIAVALVFLLIPVRALLALVIEVAINGGLDSLMNSSRMAILTPSSGPLWIDFGLSLLFGGILVPMSEEIFFRGALFTSLRGKTNFVIAMLVSSAIFAIGHMDQISVVATSLVIGLVNAWLLEKTESIWVPITVHIVNNSFGFIMLYGLMYLQQTYPQLFPGG